ncbi:hypothetical protein Y032_0003g1679 [Ancylostoma ceylanicum]|uniref:Uncharacterized protein n=1 Tax=Ancylostoma ceylanicum TaxID=53326 RepID=A0A016VZ64_9BILA|nr:hypothetical protein Y032_0003g1679 [Ancylostoma ceylanicum]
MDYFRILTHKCRPEIIYEANEMEPLSRHDYLTQLGTAATDNVRVPCNTCHKGYHNLFNYLLKHCYARPCAHDDPVLEFPGEDHETILIFDQVWVGLLKLPPILLRPTRALKEEFDRDHYDGQTEPRPHLDSDSDGLSDLD